MTDSDENHRAATPITDTPADVAEPAVDAAPAGDDDGATLVRPEARPGRCALQRVQPAGNAEVIALTGTGYLLGRSRACDIPLFAPTASREHAELRWREGAWFLAPREGKVVIANGRVAKKEIRLEHRMQLKLGGDELLFLDEEAAASGEPIDAATQAAPRWYWWIAAALGLAALAGLLWVVSASAQDAPACSGDCDRDGAVRIEELLRGVNIALGNAGVTLCEAADDDGDGQVAVNELILAVIKALIGCQLEGEEAAEAAATVALGVTESVEVINFGSVAAGGGGRAGTGQGAGQPVCAGGGVRDETCVPGRDSATVTTVYTACRTPLTETLAIVLDGRVERTVADGTYCATRLLRLGTQVTERFTGFRQQVTDTRRGTVAEYTATLERAFALTDRTCAGEIGDETLDGRLSFRCADDHTLLPCPPGGRDVALKARGLRVVRGATATTDGCQRATTLIGVLETHDRISGQRFDALYRQLLVREDRDRLDGSTLVRLDGALGVDCLGEIAFMTDVPLRFGGARCPAGGLLLTDLPGGAQSVVRYDDDGGAEIDFDGDGQADERFDSCEDPALARCS